ncbi:MAG TPA: hypothetical protein VK251_06885 [Steroidobacteraceae bacterium]|nr:hypothetical protein [Steroidobacteraceae bacterium]
MLHQGTSWLFGPSPALFVAASLVLAITPGPGVIYLVTRTLSQGGRASYARYFTALTLIALGILVACEGPRTAR